MAASACPCMWSGARVRCSVHEPAARSFLADGLDAQLDGLRDQIRRAAAAARADIAAVARQDDDGVFTITTLTTQEHP